MTEASQAFDQLDRTVRRWVWRQQWNELRDIQERAVAPILNGRDVLISSATASGKTEAAFLPICSALAEDAAESLGVIYIAPLKALINDQQRRLDPLFECINAAVTPWHGDIASSVKRRFVERPKGALLITPESLEALFVTRGTAVPRLVEALRYIVVDELHAFIGTERGRQLQSLMHRMDVAAKRRVPRVALSATLGDLDLASEFLLPRRGGEVERITSSALGREVKMQVRGYRITRPQMGESEAAAAERAGDSVELEQMLTGDDLEISRHLYETLRGGTHLVFANRRVEVERFADLLRRRAERARLPNEFWPHHGSLSREIREESEERLQGTRPATVVATTTLELGIDIGAVDSIAQIGAPGSVASLKQRLGRSGRQAGAPSVIRIYVQEKEIGENTPPQDQLRDSLVQTVAMIRLLIKRWVEPPPPAALHLSTLVQQVLSLTAQHGGFRAADAYRALCSSGPFDTVDQSTFAQLLRDLASHDLVSQTHDGTMVLDLPGERLVNHYDFYAAFTSPDEWRLLANGRTLGTLPVTFPLAPDLFLIFAGRRWRIVEVHEERHEAELEPAHGGVPPQFGGSGAVIHDRVREEMRQVYEDNDTPVFLDAAGRELLAEGRKAFQRFALRGRPFLHHGRHTLLFPWAGDRIMNTMALQLRARQLAVAIEGMALLVRDTTPVELQEHIQALADAGPPDTGMLATSVENKRTEKHHVFLSDDLLDADYASSQLDSEGAWRTVVRLSTFEPEPTTGTELCSSGASTGDRTPRGTAHVTVRRAAGTPFGETAQGLPRPTPPSPEAVDRLRSARFAAIDFETATEQRASACAVAVTLVDGGQVTNTRRWLIRPPENDYSGFNIAIHGIRPEDTMHSPEFLEVWREVLEVIGDRPLVAHNASFDLSVLRQSLDHEGAEWPTLDVFCTLLLSRRIWPGLPSYSLPPLARFLGVPIGRHHDPVEDAIACAEIARRVCAAVEIDDLLSLTERMGFQPGTIAPGMWEPPRSGGGSRTSIAQLEPTTSDFDPDHPFFERRVAFTGSLLSMSRNEAAQLVVDAGGRAMTSVSKQTDFLVFGEQDFSKFVDGEMSAKTRQTVELAEAGHPIEIISEADFMEMITIGENERP